MSEKRKPGNVMAGNIENVIKSQTKTLDETTTKEEVKKKLAPSTLPDEVYKSKEKKPEEDKMVFKGFQYSSVTVAKAESYLPVANIKLRQSPIVFEEELNLAQTIIEEKDILMDTLVLLYNHIVEGPKEMTDSLGSFLSHLHEQDMQPLLYGFYLNSYGPEIEPDEEVNCVECGGKHKIQKINLLDIYSEVPFDGEAFESLGVLHELDLSEEGTPAKFYLKFPTMDSYKADKKVSKKTFLSDISSGELVEYVKKFDYDGKEYDDYDSIKSAIGSLNVPSRRKLKKAIDENFKKYGIKFIYKWKCQNEVDDPDNIKENAKKICNKENEKNYKINELFFREISESIS